MESLIIKSPKADISESSIQQMDGIIAAMRANQPAVAQTTARERIVKLKRLKKAVFDNRTRIHDALYADYKKPAPEVDLTEIFVVTSELKHTIRNLKKWMKPHRVKPTLALLSTRSRLHYEPRGVVLIISPWNFPFNLTFGPLVSAVAAGNCMVIKPSEFTPHTSAIMKEILAGIFPEDEVCMIEGGPEVSSELIKKPFDHIFFTGSTHVGKIVMKAAAENLTSVTLELGGKSPVIVDETAHLDDAAKKVAWGKYVNKGQACISPDYLLVHESKYEPFMEKLKTNIQQYYGETEADRQKSHHLSRIVSSKHQVRLAKMIYDTVEGGAEIEIGGVSKEDENYISPTVLSGISMDSPVMQEEIFGPILPVIKYRTLDEVLPILSEREKPLALYIFSGSRKNIDFILSNTTAGGTCINEVMLQFMHNNLPFGGVNNSGHGSSHGYFGFKTFSHERAVLKHHRFSPLKLMYPPYTKTVQKLIDLTLKYL